MQALRDFLAKKSQRQFAKSVGISDPYLSQILSGLKRPSFDLMCRIETATDGKVTLDSWRRDQMIENED